MYNILDSTYKQYYRLTDVENKIMDTKYPRGGVDGTNWEIGIDIYKICHIFYIYVIKYDIYKIDN